MSYVRTSGRDLPADIQNGGSQEMSVASLNGLLADQQTPLIHTVDKHTDVARKKFYPSLDYALGNAVEDWSSSLCANGANAFTRAVPFQLPDDWVSTTHLHAIVIPLATGNLYWRVLSEIAAIGEAYTTELSSALAATAVVANILKELPDCAATVLAGVAAGDYIGLCFNRAANNAFDTSEDSCYFIGFILEYVGSQ